MKILDGFGKQCPMPLVMAKKELDAGATELAIQVDNETAVKNLTRLGKKKNMATSVDKIEGGWLITFGEGLERGIVEDFLDLRKRAELIVRGLRSHECAFRARNGDSNCSSGRLSLSPSDAIAAVATVRWVPRAFLRYTHP